MNLSDSVRVYLSGVDCEDKARTAADILVDALLQVYRKDAALSEKLDAQQKTFAVLNELGSTGYDMIPQYESVCAIIDYHVAKYSKQTKDGDLNEETRNNR